MKDVTLRVPIRFVPSRIQLNNISNMNLRILRLLLTHFHSEHESQSPVTDDQPTSPSSNHALGSCYREDYLSVIVKNSANPGSQNCSGLSTQRDDGNDTGHPSICCILRCHYRCHSKGCRHSHPYRSRSGCSGVKKTSKTRESSSADCKAPIFTNWSQTFPPSSPVWPFGSTSDTLGIYCCFDKIFILLPEFCCSLFWSLGEHRFSSDCSLIRSISGYPCVSGSKFPFFITSCLRSLIVVNLN